MLIFLFGFGILLEAVSTGGSTTSYTLNTAARWRGSAGEDQELGISGAYIRTVLEYGIS